MGVMRKIVLEELLNGHLLYVDGKTKKKKKINYDY